MTELTRRRILRTTGAASTIGLAGYLNTGTQDEDEESNTTLDEEAEFNDTDIMFIRMMIPHHEGAIEMAELIPERTDREELLELRSEIIDEQEAEIELMCDLLEEADVAGCDEVGGMMPHEMGEMMGGEDMGDMMRNGEMEEMMPQDQMMTHDEKRDLRRAEDEEFDCLFAEHMISHHEGAVMMSEHVLEEGESDRVADLADEIVEAQQEEIEQMENWQDEWDC
jgi:uncharacterized protein (DUF305 family)